MENNYLLSNKTAVTLYNSAKDLPIIDYHCHLSPKEIYEDKPFDNIGEMWLAGDHYKWRLMRCAGISEDKITGRADYHEKFINFISALEFAAGNPLYYWSKMELKQFFDIDCDLTAENAEMIWENANKYIKENKLSPRKLMINSNVEIICTTDDITDDLKWHKLISQDRSFNIKVLPSFRTDNLLLMLNGSYKDYILKLSDCSGIKIEDLKSLKAAVEKRLEFFVKNGCVFTDIGMQYFPNDIFDDNKADDIFKKILKGESVDENDYLGLVGNLYVFLGKIYKKFGLTMQLHLAVTRNSNSGLFKKLGVDCGCDCVGNAIDGLSLIKILDRIDSESGLPDTIVYTLNSSNADQLASIAGAYRNVRLGAAWWFNDHKRGILNQTETMAENGVLGKFYGMLTDSRSFLSYARHDYFRRIFCSFIGNLTEKGEFDKISAQKLVKKVFYYNIKERMS